MVTLQLYTFKSWNFSAEMPWLDAWRSAPCHHHQNQYWQHQLHPRQVDVKYCSYLDRVFTPEGYLQRLHGCHHLPIPSIQRPALGHSGLNRGCTVRSSCMTATGFIPWACYVDVATSCLANWRLVSDVAVGGSAYLIIEADHHVVGDPRFLHAVHPCLEHPVGPVLCDQSLIANSHEYLPVDCNIVLWCGSANAQKLIHHR